MTRPPIRQGQGRWITIPKPAGTLWTDDHNHIAFLQPRVGDVDPDTTIDLLITHHLDQGATPTAAFDAIVEALTSDDNRHLMRIKTGDLGGWTETR